MSTDCVDLSNDLEYVPVLIQRSLGELAFPEFQVCKRIIARFSLSLNAMSSIHLTAVVTLSYSRLM